jgi:UDP-N-acetylglucosamine/UDP-N-acetylgalactosamine diphosphorylase
MENTEKYSQGIELLTKHGQEHLLGFYESLDDEEKAGLLEQIGKLDFTNIPGWIEKYVKGHFNIDIPSDPKTASYFPAKPLGAEQEQEYKQAESLGKELISAGKVAAFVVAGGQGTRLGFDESKGNFPASPIKRKTLFQIFAEKIKAASIKYDSKIPWYIMTSPLNFSQTIVIFKENDYFGLGEEDVIVFQQGTMPNFDLEGNILLADKGCVATSPDGHGGSLKALYDSGALADIKKRGIEQISYFQVDNPLVEVIDPLFVGLHVAAGAEMSSKALLKAYPTEKVGNFCLVDGKVTVIEYSDLSDEQVNQKNSDGSFVFELGSTAIHIISASFVEHLNANGFSLPFHRAEKKIPYVDADGNNVLPAEPNGVKLETFVFDALPLARESIILQTPREDEFAPIKNATGVDSPEVTRRMMTEKCANWLAAAGVAVPKNDDGSVNCVIEIAPSFAIDVEELKGKAGQIPQIKPGDKIYLE